MQTVTKAMKLEDDCFLKAMTNLDSMLKSRDITLPTKVHMVEAMVSPGGHAQMWELDCQEGRMPKNWCL